MTCQVPHRIRRMGPGDRGFCHDGWLRSSADAPNVRWVPGALYLRMQSPRIHTWLDRFGAFVACAKSEPDVLLGFVCSPMPGLVFYLYVKHDMRRMGVARSLWDHANGWGHMDGDWQDTGQVPVRVTHWGETCPSITEKHPSLMVYDPSHLEDPRRRLQRRMQTETLKTASAR